MVPSVRFQFRFRLTFRKTYVRFLTQRVAIRLRETVVSLQLPRIEE